MSHYDYLNEYLMDFFKAVGVESECNSGIIIAHGDKCYGYKHVWEEGGLHFYHGAAIYLLSYVRPFNKESRETENGWVDVGQ